MSQISENFSRTTDGTSEGEQDARQKIELDC